MLNPENMIADEVIKAVLLHITDGFRFEDLIKKLLQEKYGWQFTPAGGIHDGGADSFVYYGNSNQEVIQVSIQKSWTAKIKKTVEALKKSGLLTDKIRLSYVTSIEISPLEISDLSEELLKDGIILQIKDQHFVTNLINSTQNLRAIFCDFCSHYGVINQIRTEATKVFGSKNIDKTIVFLKHFIEEEGSHDFLESLVKTNFFFALIGTDPDRDQFSSKEQILTYIKSALPNVSRLKIDELVADIISFNNLRHRDEREFRQHQDKYCLSYKVRQRVVAWQAHDLNIYAGFVDELLIQLDKKFSVNEEKAKKLLIPELIRDGLSEVFRFQGLSFMSLILGSESSTFELDLPDVVQRVVSESELNIKFHKEAIKICIDALYDLIWKPTKDQKEYLNAMAKTYALMFTGKADLQVLENLKNTAKGSMFLLGTDLIIKLLSEAFLQPEYQRFTNLIRSLAKLGVKIYVNANILKEASFHLKKTSRWYSDYVAPFLNEAQKDSDYAAVVDFEEKYSNLILVRAFHHAKINGKVKTIQEFFAEFVNSDFMEVNLSADIQNYLQGGFGISVVSEFLDEESAQFKWIEDQIASVAFSKLTEDHKAKIVKNDAQTVLTVYQLRSKYPMGNNDSSIFSQKVWWLTNETKIERLRNAFKDKFGEMPNMSPLAVLALLANISDLEKSSDGIGEVLSSALGLNMSHFVENEVMEQLHVAFEGVKGMSEGKKRVIVGQIAEKLRTGDVREIRELAKPVFDTEADSAKVLEPYYVIRANEGFHAVWAKLKTDFSDSGQRLKLLSILMDCRLKDAASWLRQNNYSDDLADIASIMVKITDKEPA